MPRYVENPLAARLASQKSKHKVQKKLDSKKKSKLTVVHKIK